MKKFYLRLLMMTVLVSMVGKKAMAYDAFVDGIYYKLSGNEATVTCRLSNALYNEEYYKGKIVIPSTIEYKSQTYSVTSIGDKAFMSCYYLTDITIPNSVTSIGNHAFCNCSSLTFVFLSNSITTIGYDAFSGCSGLISITLPNSLTTIGSSAFNGCSSITSITLGKNVTSIGDMAFYNCDKLKTLRLFSATPPVLGGYTLFYDLEGFKLYVLSESINAYKTADIWSYYTEDVSVLPMPNPTALTTLSAEDAHWATYYNDNANVKVDDNTTVYKAELVGSTITLTDTGSKIIKAGEAVVLKSTSAQIALAYTAVQSTADYGNNCLEGSNSLVFQESGYVYYTLSQSTQGLGFYQVSDDQYVNSNQAYIKVDNTAETPGFMAINSVATSIAPVLSSAANNAAYYDLSGRRVENPTKHGVYIHDGKKVMIK